MGEYKQDAGGSGNTGQTSIGPNSRKLTPGEAGFRENNGVPGLRCGDCLFFEASECRIVEGRIDEDDVCDQFEPNLKDGKMYAEQGTKVAVASSAPAMGGFDMWIYRVAEKDGIRRWYSTSSGTKVDLYGERMSTKLFDDFVKRIENPKTEIPPMFTSKAWKGGLPYLGVAHYLDLDGFGIVGKADSVWRDGKVLKMKGTFDNDNPLAIAAFDSIQADRLEKRADTERVRVSIAFIDWGHNHGKGREFVRKDLSTNCPYCEAGVGDKEYTAGQLVHLALTRRPAYPETEIVALEERSMSKRRDDAASIIGDELANELEAKSKELIGRSTDQPAVAAGAVVIKDESGEMEEATSAGDERTLGGALNLDEAEAFISKSDVESPILLTPYELLTVVLANIAESDLEEKSTAIREVVMDYQNTLDARTAEAVIRIEKALGGDVMTNTTESAVERQVPPQFREDEEEERKRKRRPDEEMADEESSEEPEEEMSDEESDEEMDEGEGEEEYEDEEEEDEEMKKKSISHPLNAHLLKVREAFDEAMETPSDLRAVQESINDLGAEIKAQINEASASAPVDAATIQRAVAEAVAPLQASLAALQAQVTAGATVEKSAKVPSRRAIKMPTSQLPAQPMVNRSEAPTEDNPTPKLRQLARKSTIGYERRRRGGL